MKLQKKVFFSIVLTLASLSFIMSVTSNYKTVKAFSELEMRFFQQDMMRVQGQIDDQVHKLHQYASDWGAWDAMYDFLKTKDSTEFSALINGYNLRALAIDFFLILDDAGEIITAYTVSIMGEEVPLSEYMLKDLKKAFSFLSADKDVYIPEEHKSIDGIITLNDRPFLVSGNPILTTNWTGPSRGYVFVGFNLKEKLAGIARSLGMTPDFLPVVTGTLPERKSGDIVLNEEKEGKASIWQLRDDIIGTNQQYAIRLLVSRDVYNEGQKSLFHSYLWIIFNGIAVIVLVLKLLDVFVLRRLSKMQETADTITDSMNISLRVPVSSSDEISALGDSFNVLLNTLENLLMDIPDPMFITDTSGHIIQINTAALRVIGIKFRQDSDIEGIHLSSILRKKSFTDAKDMKPDRDAFLFKSGEFHEVYEAQLISRENSEPIDVEIHQQMIVFGKKYVVLFLARDLRDRKKLERRLEYRAYYDDLTGLPNRISLIEKLTVMLKGYKPNPSKKTAFVVMNMDHFKLINSQLGSSNGDRVLLIIAERLKDLLLKDAEIFRTGGDEFTLLFRDLDSDSAVKFLKDRIAEVHNTVSAPCSVGDGSVYPSISIGVITNIFDKQFAKNPTLVIEKAMQALKRAKKTGLGITVFHDEEKQNDSSLNSIDILVMRAELHSALEREEFIPYFQPIYDIKSRTLSGFETLVRWQHPTKGFMPPGQFIPYAESMGLVGDIDRLMVVKALETLNDIPSHIYISANGSSNFLHIPNVEEILQSCLDRTGADPSRFVLEVTESVLIDNFDSISKLLEKLRKQGIRIYLDDFGTGYSSLQYVHSLPLDCLKLDMSFVSRVLNSEKDARILRSIIDMANALNLDTIAEGVESEEQLLWLKDAGCNKAQGYYFSKPMPLKAMKKLACGE